MKRLIDADKIMDELRDYADRKCANGYMDTANGILSAVNYIRNNVTRVDAVPVVRCRDCKHKGWVQEPCHGRSLDYCKLWECVLDNLDTTFCSYGERKDGDGNA